MQSPHDSFCAHCFAVCKNSLFLATWLDDRGLLLESANAALADFRTARSVVQEMKRAGFTRVVAVPVDTLKQACKMLLDDESSEAAALFLRIATRFSRASCNTLVLSFALLLDVAGDDGSPGQLSCLRALANVVGSGEDVGPMNAQSAFKTALAVAHSTHEDDVREAATWLMAAVACCDRVAAVDILGQQQVASVVSAVRRASTNRERFGVCLAVYGLFRVRAFGDALVKEGVRPALQDVQWIVASPGGVNEEKLYGALKEALKHMLAKVPAASKPQAGVLPQPKLSDVTISKTQSGHALSPSSDSPLSEKPTLPAIDHPELILPVPVTSAVVAGMRSASLPSREEVKAGSSSPTLSAANGGAKVPTLSFGKGGGTTPRNRAMSTSQSPSMTPRGLVGSAPGSPSGTPRTPNGSISHAHDVAKSAPGLEYESVVLHPVSEETSVKCFECGLSLSGNCVSLSRGGTKRFLHTSCFKCKMCQAPFESKLYWQHRGTVMCQKDFLRAVGLFCATCGSVFTGGFYRFEGKLYCDTHIVDVVGTKCAVCDKVVLGGVRTLDLVFCEDHFVCADCKKPFGSDGFYLVDGKVFCKDDAKKAKSKLSICGRCEKPIRGVAIKALGKTWCQDHLLCHVCEKDVVDAFYESAQGHPVCKDHKDRRSSERRLSSGSVIKTTKAERGSVEKTK